MGYDRFPGGIGPAGGDHRSQQQLRTGVDVVRPAHITVQIPVQVVCFSAGAVIGHTRFQAGHDAQEREARCVSPARYSHPQILGGREREPEIDPFQIETCKALRHDSNHGNGCAATEEAAETQVDGAAQHIGGAAEMPPPEAVADHCRQRNSRFVVGGGEEPSPDRFHPEKGGESGSGGAHPRPVSFAPPAEGDILDRGVGGYAGKARDGLHCFIIGIGKRDAQVRSSVRYRTGAEDPAELLVFLDMGRRLEQDAVENAEHDGIGPDSQGQDADDGQREAGCVSQGTQGVGEILP